jgi:hypothetical protein
MPEEEIDYKALYERIQGELIEARISILKMRQAPMFRVDQAGIRAWIQENYIVIVVAIMFATFVISGLSTLKEVFKKDGHSE